MEDDTYGLIGVILGGIVGVIVFGGSWIYCIAEYGYLWGVGFGWLPSIIVAFIAFVLVRWLWGLVVLLIVIGILYALNHHSSRKQWGDMDLREKIDDRIFRPIAVSL